jgi:peptide/nickel transport system permease protein
MFRDNRWIRIIRPKLKEWKITAMLLRRNNLTKIALSIALFLILIALFASYVIPYPEHIEDEVNLEHKLEAPSLQYFFGTDEMGRDIFSRVVYGTKISLTTALFAVLISMLIGIPLGAIAGTTGGKVDEIIMRTTDMIMGFPPLLLCIAITSLLGPSLKNVILAISIAWWPLYARLVRGQAVSIRERQFVKSAQAIGTPHMSIVFKHVIPNCISPVIVQASIDIGGAILTVASLSFLGLGAQAPIPEWGLMISTSRNYFLNAWWYSMFPGLAIFFTVLVFNLLGDGLREILDPKTRKN